MSRNLGQATTAQSKPQEYSGDMGYGEEEDLLPANYLPSFQLQQAKCAWLASIPSSQIPESEATSRTSRGSVRTLMSLMGHHSG